MRAGACDGDNQYLLEGLDPAPERDLRAGRRGSDLHVVHEAVHQREPPPPLVGAAGGSPPPFVFDDHHEVAVVATRPHDQVAGFLEIRVLDRVRRRLVRGERDLRPDVGLCSLPLEPPAQLMANGPQLLRSSRDPHLEARGRRAGGAPVLLPGHAAQGKRASPPDQGTPSPPGKSGALLAATSQSVHGGALRCESIAHEGNLMKKLLASVAVTGLLVGGAATTAWAAGPAGTSGGSGGGSAGAHQGRRGHGVRLAILTAASTIGVQPADLLTQIRGGKTVAQVATEHGVDPAGVVSAIVVAGTRRIDQAAARGTIDASKADQAKQKLPDVANRFLNEPKPTNGNGRGYGLRKEALQAAAEELETKLLDRVKQFVNGERKQGPQTTETTGATT